ncbi:AP-3 complex subunit sigma-1 isoform X3 [Pelecanus crispus]|uniref:AP-3 complex subunit sigma-1 isoform X3 n=1 Tax=Pelecanus crispus TaxID=36300 RepID=UPI003F5D0303
MIKAILIFNNHGKPRLSKFYQRYSEDTQQQIIRETFHLVSKRDENVCNFLEGGLLIGGSDNKLIYRHYATLYFVFCVDSSESELGILDLIQVHNILAEMVMGGMVLETNMNEIVTQIDAQNKLEKSEKVPVSQVITCLNIPQEKLFSGVQMPSQVLRGKVLEAFSFQKPNTFSEGPCRASRQMIFFLLARWILLNKWRKGRKDKSSTE